VKKAALICVTRNNAEKLRKTLASVIRNTDPEKYDLFVIDNSSSDSTLGIYQQQIIAENIRIVRSGKDLRLVGGTNLGLGMTKDYGYVGLLGDDIEVSPGWLENFFDVLDSNPDLAAVGPLASGRWNRQNYDTARIAFPDWNLPALEGISRADIGAMAAEMKSNWVGHRIDDNLSFLCVLIRRAAIDKAGELDPLFAELFCGHDDDYCHRLKRAGYGLAVSTRTFVVSGEDGPPETTPGNDARKRRAEEILENKRKDDSAKETKKISSPSSGGPQGFANCTGPLVAMRACWEPLLPVLPFFDHCAKKFKADQPFPHTGSYVFNPGKPLALCTLYTPEVAAFGAECEKSILSYCLRHDLTAYIYREGIYPGIHPTWHKARLILNHLHQHQSMVWLDADTLILGQEQRVFEDISANEKHFHICRDLEGGSTTYNAGVFLVRSTDWCRRLMEDCDRFARMHRPAQLWDHGSDQKVICDFILERDPQGAFHQVHEMSEFNTEPRFMEKDTFLLHFMHYPAGYKIPWMNYCNASSLQFDEARFSERINALGSSDDTAGANSVFQGAPVLG